MKTHNAFKKELMKSDLEHYEKISDKAMEWHNTIPKAIKEYYSNDRKCDKIGFFSLGILTGMIIVYAVLNCL